MMNRLILSQQSFFHFWHMDMFNWIKQPTNALDKFQVNWYKFLEQMEIQIHPSL